MIWLWEFLSAFDSLFLFFGEGLLAMVRGFSFLCDRWGSLL